MSWTSSIGSCPNIGQHAVPQLISNSDIISVHCCAAHFVEPYSNTTRSEIIDVTVRSSKPTTITVALSKI